jgi:hypothetical protein
MSRLTRAEMSVVALVGGFVLLQAVVPVLVPRNELRQIEFAWEMYSRGAPPVFFLVETATGQERFEVLDVVVTGRSAIPYEDLLPPHLCERVPGAVAITPVVSGDKAGAISCP